jgi:hypothetical protein
MNKSKIEDEWDEPLSSDCKEDPEEVIRLADIYAKEGEKGLNQLERSRQPVKDIVIKPNYDTNFPTISQTMMKDLLFKGDEIPYCPQKFYHMWILKDVSIVPSLSMQKGSYGETKLLGGSAKGQFTHDLPRKQNGDKTIDQERIDIQIQRAQRTILENEIHIISGINTQVVLKKIMQGKLVQGELDIFPVIMLDPDYPDEPDKYVIAFIDVKFTANINSTFGLNNRPGWGDYANMDHNQMELYHELVRDIDYELNDQLTEEQKILIKKVEGKDIRAYYWLFDFAVPIDALSDKFKEVTWTPIKKNEIQERLRKVISIIEFHNANDDWDRCEPIDCNKCPVPDCIFKNKIEKV